MANPNELYDRLLNHLERGDPHDFLQLFKRRY